MFVRLSAAIAALSLVSGAAFAAGPTDPQIAHIAYTAGVIDVVAAFGLAGSRKVECDDVQVGVKLLHQGDEGFGAAHEAVDEDERRLILRCLSLFEVREAKAVHHNLAAFYHGSRHPSPDWAASV